MKRGIEVNDNRFANLIRVGHAEEDLGLHGSQGEVEDHIRIGYYSSLARFGRVDLWECKNYDTICFTPFEDKAVEFINEA